VNADQADWWQSPAMLRSDEMRAKADRCDELALAAEPVIASFFRDAAWQWRRLADQLELLEYEPTYRIIRRQLET
jgi:hypothetical protein